MNLCAIAILFSALFCVHRQYHLIRDFVVKNKNFIFVPELGGYLNKKNQSTLEYIRKNKDLLFFEEYNGIPMALLKQKPLTKVDSIIHALGSKRDTFRKEIEKNRYHIMTSSNPEKTTWVNWNMAQSWYFYKNLFLNYEIDHRGHKLLFWKKKKTKSNVTKVHCKTDDEKKNVIINNGKPGFYSLKLSYNFKKNSYLLVDVNLPFVWGKKLSLPPHLNSFEFPVNFKGRLDFKTIPKTAKKHLTLISCSAEDFTSIMPFKQSELIVNLKENEI